MSLHLFLPRVSILFTFLVTACVSEQPDAHRSPPAGRLETVSSTVPGWRIQEVARVGGENASESELLYTVPKVVEDAQGRFYVLNTGNRNVLAFDSSGKYRMTIGKPGTGPGEFLVPGAIASVGDDALLVLDVQQSRISEFRRSNGTFVQTLPTSFASGSLRDLRATTGGVLFVEVQELAEPAGGVSVATKGKIARLDVKNGELTPLVELDSVSRFQVSQSTENGRATRFLDRPFTPKPTWDVDTQGTVLFGNGAQYTVYRATSDGVRPAFHVQGEAQAVTDEDRQTYIEQRKLEAAAGEIEFPSWKPYFSRLLFDSHGYVWMLVPTRGSRQIWEIRDHAGRKAGEVALPEDSRLVGLSPTSLYVIRWSEDDVETLVKYRLERVVASRDRSRP